MFLLYIFLWAGGGDIFCVFLTYVTSTQFTTKSFQVSYLTPKIYYFLIFFFNISDFFEILNFFNDCKDFLMIFFKDFFLLHKKIRLQLNTTEVTTKQ